MPQLADLFEVSALNRLSELLASEPDAATRALIEIELQRRVSVETAAEINGVHPSTFERNFSHLIRRFGPRLKMVRLRDALTLPPPSTAPPPA